MTPGKSQTKSNKQGQGGRKRKGRSMWISEEESPAPAARPLTWRKGVGQFVSNSFDAAAIALRNRLGLNTETNFLDNSATGTPGTTLALLDAGAALPIGATAGTSQRIGREVRVVRWLHRGYIYSPSSMTGVCLVRVVAVFNRQQDGTPFTVGQVLADPTNIMSLSAGDLTERGGTVVFDRTFRLLGAAQCPSANDQIQHYEFEFTAPDWHLSWPVGNTAGAQTDNLGGALTVYTMARGAGVTSPNQPFYSRCEYVDN